MSRAVVLLLFCLAVVAGGVRAVSIDGVDIEGPEGVTLFHASGLTPFLFTYEKETPVDPYVPCFDGICLWLTPDAGLYEWDLTSAGTSRIAFNGTPTSSGEAVLFGLPSITYQVVGVSGMATFFVNGPRASFTIPAGEQTIVITPASTGVRGNRLLLDAMWSPSDGGITVTVIVQDEAGAGLDGQNTSLDVGLYLPGNTTLGGIEMFPGPIQGSYVGVANLVANTFNGSWYIFASYNGTSATRVVAVGPISVPPEAVGVQLSDVVAGPLTVAESLVALAWFFAFLWTAHRRYIVCAGTAWVGILMPFFVGGLGITFVGTVAAFMLFLFVYIILEWRKSFREDAQRSVSPRRGGG